MHISSCTVVYLLIYASYGLCCTAAVYFHYNPLFLHQGEFFHIMHLQPLEDTIYLKLIPAFTSHSAHDSHKQDVFSLPCHLGGLSIVNPEREIMIKCFTIETHIQKYNL